MDTTNDKVLLVQFGKEYSGSPLRSGLVRFRNRICCEAAPTWGHFVGLTETAIIDRCKVNGYRYEWQQETPPDAT